MTRTGITAMTRGLNTDDLRQIQSNTDKNCQYLRVAGVSPAPAVIPACLLQAGESWNPVVETIHSRNAGMTTKGKTTQRAIR